MSINLQCDPVVKDINVRTVGIDDDRVVYADIKLQASVDPAELNQFLPNKASDKFWEIHGESHIPLFPNLNQLSIKGTWGNIDCKLAPDESFFEASNIKNDAVEIFHGGELRKFKFTPMNDSVFLDFEYTAQMPGGEIGKLIDRILDQQVACQVFSTQGELDL